MGRIRQLARVLVMSPSLLAVGCASAARTPPPIALPFTADSLRARQIRPGVTHRYIYAASGPWAIHVLDVDLRRCYSPVAVKGFPGAIGRERTSTMLRNLDRARDVVGGVNGDFFLFTPPGVPTNAMISGSRVVTGPNVQPMFAIDDRGAPIIARLNARGTASVGGQSFALTAWNRTAIGGLALFDGSWGNVTDTMTSAVEVVITGRDPRIVSAVDTLTGGVAIPTDGAVLIAGRNAPDSVRSALRALKPGQTISAEIALAPLHPREAVGGRPGLVRDSVILGDVDSVGGAGFATTRHPRTAVGIARNGTRLLLVVVDGRQQGYSMGMTLRELANLMLGLGAREAINLDGGGSTAFVVADPDSAGALQVANKPSDPAGERPVANALAIVSSCR
jgi:hypothetical protein